MKPIFDRVLVEKIEDKIYESGDYHIINHGEKIPGIGKVLECGRECKEVQAGDIVMYGPYSGSNLMIKGHNCVLMRESDVMAIL